MSLRFVPSTSDNYATHVSNTNQSSVTSKGAPSAPGVHDTFRAKLTQPVPARPSLPADSSSSSSNEKPVSSHPLEARLRQWRTTQDSMKMKMLRRVYGIAEPARRQMELKMVRDADVKPAALGGGQTASVHEDILGGRDTEVTWEDVFLGDDRREPASFHDEMEHRLRMNW